MSLILRKIFTALLLLSAISSAHSQQLQVSVDVVQSNGSWTYNYTVTNNSSEEVLGFGLAFAGVQPLIGSPSNWLPQINDVGQGEVELLWNTTFPGGQFVGISPGVAQSGFTLESMTPPQLINYSLVQFAGAIVDGARGSIVGPGDLLEPVTDVVGDYNGDGFVSLLDYDTWARTYGGRGAADGNKNAIVDAADYTVWRDAYSEITASQAVPEPSSFGAILMGFFAISATQCRDSILPVSLRNCPS